MNMNPNSAQDRASNPHPALGLAFRVDQIITALRHLINARAPLLGIFFMPLHLRLGRSMRRLTTLLTRLATGQYPSPRPARPSHVRRRCPNNPPNPSPRRPVSHDTAPCPPAHPNPRHARPSRARMSEKR